MPRVKRGTLHLKRRKNILKQTKGYRWGRKSKIKLAQTAILKAGVNAYRDRRNKKRERKGIWHVQINAAARELNTTFSKLMGALHKKQIALDKKSLSMLARTYPQVWQKLVHSV